MKKLAKTAVLSLVKEANNAVSHNDLLKQMGANYNRVTIYRSLDKLVEERAIHKIIDMDGVSKYAICHNCKDEHSHNHIHFSCVNCQSVSCLENVVPTFSMPKSYKILDINFTVSGLCPNCTTNEPSTATNV